MLRRVLAGSLCLLTAFAPASAGPLRISPRPPAPRSVLVPVPLAARTRLPLPPPALAARLPGAPAAHAALSASLPAATSGRAHLRAAAAALAQQPRAAAAKPALARLGAPLPPPSPQASAIEQSAGARSYFLNKAFGPNDTFAVEGFFDASASGSGGGRGKKPPATEEAREPKYPSRPIAFNEGAFPSVAFAPDRPIEPILVDAIERSRGEIVLALYEFKSTSILRALRAARERGVKIRVLLDYENAFPRRRPNSDYVPHRSLEVQALVNEGFDVLVLDGLWRFGIQHNKFGVFDGKLGFWGSYNLSYASERHHFENINFTDDPRRLSLLLGYAEHMRSLAVPFDKALAHAWPKEIPPPPRAAERPVRLGETAFPLFVFSPGGEGEDWIVRAIDSAEESVDVSMFTFRSTRIAQALLAAKRRRVKVRVLLDKSQAEQEHMELYAEWLAFHGIPVKTGAGPNKDGPELLEKNHNKLLIVDRRLVATGSMNYTKNGALMSFENIGFLDDPIDAGAFSAYYDDMFANRRNKRLPPPPLEPRLPTDKQLVSELLVEPEPLPPPKQWPSLPGAYDVLFNGETFPSSLARPHAPIAPQIARAIHTSKRSIHLALYEFDLDEVLDALRQAKARGVEVHVLFNQGSVFPTGYDHTGKPRRRKAQIQALLDEGFDVKVLRGKASGTMHHKFAVFDESLVFFGSYNFAVTAEEDHFENAKFDSERERVQFYLKVWRWMEERAKRLEDVPRRKGTQAQAGADPAEEEAPAEDGPEPAEDGAPVDSDLALSFHGKRFPRSAASPQGGALRWILRAIARSKESIEISMFSFFSEDIAKALLQAKKRGVRVRIVLDSMQAKVSRLDDWFAYHDFDVRILAGPDDFGDVMLQKNHNKYMVADGKLLITGSYNYSANAENNNHENISLYTEPRDIEFYLASFEIQYENSWKPFKPKRRPDLKSSSRRAFGGARPSSGERLDPGAFPGLLQ